jgi:2'-5' RNA ligase
MQTWRIFCAVDVSPAAREAAAAHLACLRADAPAEARVGWERPGKFHLTLKFLGGVDVARLAEVTQAARRAAAEVAPFGLVLAGVGAFPPRGAARVLWLGIKDAEGGLSRLRQRLEDECAARGFPREPRAFRPHLTLARLRAPAGARELARQHEALGFAAVEFTVSELLVMRSELGPGGSRYTTLARCPLSETHG